MPKVLQVVCDGFGFPQWKLNRTASWGLNKRIRGNAIHQAIKRGQAPFFETLFRQGMREKIPFSILQASGGGAGVPEGIMGNSEAGHTAMAAGRFAPLQLLGINLAIKSGEFFEKQAFLSVIENCKKNNSELHLPGILQDGEGSVHGNIEHLFTLMELAKKEGIKKVWIHPFTDGRDTGQKDAGNKYIDMLMSKINELGSDRFGIGVIMGREIGMDRDCNWDKILVAFKALVNGECERTFKDPKQAILYAYDQKMKDKKGKEIPETDEFIRPSRIEPFKGINPNDSVVFFNFRSDRGRELTTTFREEELEKFNFKKGTAPIDIKLFEELQNLRQKVKNIAFATMTQYYAEQNAPFAFDPVVIPNSVGEVIANAGLMQLRLAGTEKYPHVTSFFNCERKTPFDPKTEIWQMVQDLTLKARTNQGKNYDLVPEMTCYLEAQEILKALDSDIYDFILWNIQNPDMVGHTGNLEATIAAVSHVSNCLLDVVNFALSKKIKVVVTSDHGNADQMLNIKNGKYELDEKGNYIPCTTHSLNPVPFWILGARDDLVINSRGKLYEVGPTVLQLLGLPRPSEMVDSLII